MADAPGVEVLAEGRRAGGEEGRGTRLPVLAHPALPISCLLKSARRVSPPARKACAADPDSQPGPTALSCFLPRSSR